MKKTARYCMAGLLALAVWSGAASATVVTAGSDYSIYINGQSSGNALHMTNTFDSTPGVFTRGGNLLSVSEAEADLGGGVHRILVNVSSTGDLFPVVGEAGHSGLGIDGNGFDLSGDYFLQDAFIRYYIDGVEIFTSADLADVFRPLFPGAWHGRFADTGLAFEVLDLGGIGVNGYTLDFTVSEFTQPVPAPGSLALTAGALLAMVATRRRRAR